MKCSKKLRTDWLPLVSLLGMIGVLVLLSSYVQLSFFRDALQSRAWKQLAYLWVIGLWIDLLNLTTAILSAKNKTQSSATPGLALFCYSFSTLLYGSPTILKAEAITAYSQIDETLSLSFLKTTEFILLSCFHLTVTYIAAKMRRN
ncbi:hypothetical protein [Leptolyngbya sp. GGD]|nr:hypothetical protein [Leptolyngbya sp. GGD]MCY6493946.1 hypothetical protein [Leptolyngbya sp. GGD]